MRRVWVTLAVLAALSAAALGQRRDPPTFETDYTPPPTFARNEPRPWSDAMEHIDFAVLAAAMALGAYFALKRRSRAGLTVVMVFSLAYFGFYRMGCLCPIGSIQNVAEAFGGEIAVGLDEGKIAAAARAAAWPADGVGAAERQAHLREATRQAVREEFRSRLSSFECRSITDAGSTFSLTLRNNRWNRALLEQMAQAPLPSPPGAAAMKVGDVWRCQTHLGALPWLVVGIFALPLAAALFLGRVFCGSVCPIGAVQDVMLVRPLRVPGWLEHALRILAVAYLAFAVLLAVTGSIYLICAYDPFVSLFRIVPLGKFLRWGQQWAAVQDEAGEVFSNVTGRWELLALPMSFLVISLFVGRPYCRFLCPYSVLLRPLSRLTWRHASITPDQCVQCRLCEEACPFGAIDKPTPPHRPTGIDKRRLALVLAALPVLLAGGAWGGWRLGEPLARADLKVRLKDRLAVEQHFTRAEAAAERLPQTLDGRVIRLEDEDGRLLAVCEATGGAASWRTVLLDPKSDRLLRPVDADSVRLAAVEEGGQRWLLFLVRYVRAAGAKAEETQALLTVNLADGAMAGRREVPAKYNPSEAFGRRKYFAGSVEAYGPSAEGRPAAMKEAVLAQDVEASLATFHWGGSAVGVFLAATIGWELLKLSVTRTRIDYEANRASCVSCGRCFAYCPRERLRRRRRNPPKP